MDYSSLKSKKLKHLIRERKIVIPKKSTKNHLVQLLEKYDEDIKEQQRLLEKYSNMKPVDKYRDEKIAYYKYRLTVEKNLKDRIGYMKQLENLGA